MGSISGGSATEGGLTPTPTPVALLGEGEAGQAPRPVQPMTTQEVAAYRPAQDPRYDPTEGRPRASALPSALPSAGNDQIDNPLFEEQQQSDISSTAFDQGNDTSSIPFASDRQREFHSSMYGSSLERLASSSSFSESSLSTLDPSPQPPSEYGTSANPAFSSQPVLGFQQQQQPASAAVVPPSVAATSLASFYQGPYFPRKSSLTASQQLAEDNSAHTTAAQATPVSTPATPTHAWSSIPLLGGSSPQQPQRSPESLAESGEADSITVGVQSQPSTQFGYQQMPLIIPPPFSVSDESVSASTIHAGSPKPALAVSVSSPHSTAFGDGPTFAGSPLFSPPDNQDLPSESGSFAQRGESFTSELPRDPSYPLGAPPAAASAPIFQDNPVFSELEERPPGQLSAAAPLYHSLPVTHPHDSTAEWPSQSALQSSPMLSRSEASQQQALLSDELVVSEASDKAAFVIGSPSLSSTPILGYSGPSQSLEYTSSPLVPEPATSRQEPTLVASHSPMLHSSPVFSEDPIFAETQLQPHEAAAGAPLVSESSMTLTEPGAAERDLGYSSTPILSSKAAEAQASAATHTAAAAVAVPLHSEPSLALPPVEPQLGYSSQPILGAQQQQQAYHPAPVLQSEPSLALLPEQSVSAEPVGELSSQPIFGEQQQQAHQPAFATVVEPPLAVPEQLIAAEPKAMFSSQPIFGEARQWQQQEVLVPAEQQEVLSSQPILGAPQQQQQLYKPSAVPADLEAETPAVYHSPRFQSRPIFESSAQQAQHAHTGDVSVSVSADNPWADRGVDSGPSYDTPAAVEQPNQGITFHDNSLFDSAYQPEGINLHGRPPLAAFSQQQLPAFTVQQPASPATPVNQGITYFNESPLASSHLGHQSQQAYSPASVPVSVSHVPAPSFTSQPTLGLPAPTATAQPLQAHLDAAQLAQRSVNFSPVSTFTSAPGTPPVQSGGLMLYDTPPLGSAPSQVVTPVTTFTAEPTGGPEPLSDPLYDPTQRAFSTAPVPGAVSHAPALLQPLDDPLYDPLERRPFVARATHPVRPSVLLQPLDDPLYDPTVQGPPRPTSVTAAPHGPRFVAAQNSRFPKQQSDPLYDPAAVETVPGLKDVTHRGEQVGTPTLAQGPTARGHTPQQPPQGRTRPPSTEGYSSRPILDGSRRAARTVNLTNIGRPAQAPAAPKPYTPVQPKEGHQLGGADVLPQDSHYVKPTPYAELGSHARSALSGAGWKTTWAMEMEDAHQSGTCFDPPERMCRLCMAALQHSTAGMHCCFSCTYTQAIHGLADSVPPFGLHERQLLLVCVSV